MAASPPSRPGFVEEVEIQGHIIDSLLLPKVLDAASRFEKRPSSESMAAMLDMKRMTSLFGLAT